MSLIGATVEIYGLYKTYGHRTFILRRLFKNAGVQELRPFSMVEFSL